MVNCFSQTVFIVSRSSRQEVDSADHGGAEGVCDAAAGRPGGDRPGQETEGGQGHPLPGTGCVGCKASRPAIHFITANILLT